MWYNANGIFTREVEVVMRFIIGFLIGMLISVVVVLLITPQSGKDLKKGVRSRIDTIINDGRRAYDQRRAELEARVIELRGE
jgi:gas vesicle protein